MVMQPLLGYESFYKINTNGEVFSIRRNHMLKYRISNGGYKRVKLYNETGHKEITVHGLVGMQYIVNKNNKPDINHIDAELAKRFNVTTATISRVVNNKYRMQEVQIGY